jgi:predicted regulator of Ras-like GTPase activity (Roadblock/LC7/MglB family)
MINNTDIILYDEEYQKFKVILDVFLQKSGSRYAFLLSKSGQVLVESGNTNILDVTSLASLIAGAVSATAGLATIIDEEEFSVLFHEGKQNNIYNSILNEKLIFVVIFSKTTSLGLVRLKMKAIVSPIKEVYDSLLKKMESHSTPKFLENITDEDIDNLFDF